MKKKVIIPLNTKTATISTSHITQQDDVVLNNCCHNIMTAPLFIFAIHRHGYILSPAIFRISDTSGLSSGFQALMELCFEQKINKLILDCDGDEIDGLQKFDW